MDTLYYKVRTLCVSVLLLSFALQANTQTDIFWVGGSGDWDDMNHWMKSSGGTNIAGVIPDEDINAIIDMNSGLNSNSTITIPPGNHDVNDIVVTNTSGFTLLFDGSASNGYLEMDIYGDLYFEQGFNLEFTEYSIYANVLRFVSNNQHDITADNHDLMNVVFYNAGGDYNQMGPLWASERIRMYGGTWNSNNEDITTNYLHFQDNNSSSNPLTKVFNSGTSDIFCDEWSSKFVYQSLVVTGDHTIYTSKFTGTHGTQFNSFSFNNIHLLEYSDIPPGGTSPIENNNFECTFCEIDELIIEDTGDTRLAGIFTIKEKLEVTNNGSTIQFNGGNNRSGEVIIDGSIITPSISGCDERTIFTNIYNDFTTMTRSTGTLEVFDASINNITTNGGANFNTYNSVLLGYSDGWNIQTNPYALDYYWIGPTNGSFGDWDNPDYWSIEGEYNNGCIPSIVDNVFINDYSKGDIQIPLSYVGECNNFIWTNTEELTLKLNGTASSFSELKISGSLFLDESATITSLNFSKIRFYSTSTNAIETNGVYLPRIYFEGPLAVWKLVQDLDCEEIRSYSGTLKTLGKDITTDYWAFYGTEPYNHLILGDSHILVNGVFELLPIYSPLTDIAIVTPGTSLIECEEIVLWGQELYDLKLNNASTHHMSTAPVVLNSLILGTDQLVYTNNDLTLNNLIFEVDGSTLALKNSADNKIFNAIESQAASSSPGILKGYTTNLQSTVIGDETNLCVSGHVAFQDINVTMDGVFHAPDGINWGNNNGINFDSTLR